MLDGTREILAIELQGLIDIDFEVELTGFNLAETDFILDDAAQADPEGTDEPEGAVPSLWEVAVNRPFRRLVAGAPQADLRRRSCDRGLPGLAW